MKPNHTHLQTHLSLLSRCVLISPRSLRCHVSNVPPHLGLRGFQEGRGGGSASVDWCGRASNADGGLLRAGDGSEGREGYKNQAHLKAAPGERRTAAWEHQILIKQLKTEDLPSLDRRMWIYRSFLCVALVCGLTLDSNTIRTSRESTLQSSELQVRTEPSHAPLLTPAETETLLELKKVQTFSNLFKKHLFKTSWYFLIIKFTIWWTV